MLIINTLSILIQIFFIVSLSFLSMNIIRLFKSVRKMAVYAPAVFVNHGGGPLPLLSDKDHEGLTIFLRDTFKEHVDLKDIKAIILITAHWEEPEVTISSSTHHDLLFDYYGFPPESYNYKYNAPGSPELAERVYVTLKQAGIPAKLDFERGWDHGVFVPMLLINPSADIPIVQLSVIKSQDPEEHYNLGKALHKFRKEGIAIIGSGMSYHNMREFMHSSQEGTVVNEDFSDFINKVCTEVDEEERKASLIAWRYQIGSFDAHPPHRAEHFMPLIVVAGAGGPKPGERIFSWDMKGTFRLNGYIWKDL